MRNGSTHTSERHNWSALRALNDVAHCPLVGHKGAPTWPAYFGGVSPQTYVAEKYW